MKEYIWQEPSPPSYPEELLRLTGNNRIIAQALFTRGYDTAEKAAGFLDPDRRRPSNPTVLPDMDKAADRILHAIHTSERVAVWGDFDVDGQTSTAILVGGLRLLGADVIFHIPVREKESHGVNLPGLRELMDRGARLVVTCDTGIADYEAADFCSAAGVDYIITDHHSLPDELPHALAIVNPRRLPAGHPAGSLSGAGCAWFLLREVAERRGKPEIAFAQLDLAALGLVADLVELSGDSRWIAQKGIRLLRDNNRPALAAIASTAGLDLRQLTEEHISFIIAPRLNALGRLGDVNEMVDFFFTDDPVKAGVTAALLDGLNLRRKLLTEQVYAAAVGQVESGRLDRDHEALVLYHPEWPAGVLGIAASRVVETYHLPTILLTGPEDGEARGSARSVEGIDITAAISSTASLLRGFGGHPMAGGLSLPAENIPRFWKELERTIQTGRAGRPLPLVLNIDASLALPDINIELATQIESLAPFGPGNPPLLFITRDLSIASSRTLGRPGDHLQLTVRDAAGNSQKVLWWNGAGKPLPEGVFDLAYHLRASSYLGEPQLQVAWATWRQRDASTISAKSAPTRRWVDLRDAFDPGAELGRIVKHPSTLIWQEGAAPSPFPGASRYEVVPADNLVIWTCPPGWDDLHQVVETSDPRNVYLFAQPSEPARPGDLLRRLLGLMQYAVDSYQGWISIEKLAGLTALPEEIARLGIDLAVSRSFFHISDRDGNRLRIEKSSGGAVSEFPDLEEDFIYLVTEVNSFRDLFRTSALEEIMKKIY